MKKFAVAIDEKKVFSIPGNQHRLTVLDIITDVKSIDWGADHCIFVDKKNRVYMMGRSMDNEIGYEHDDESYGFSKSSISESNSLGIESLSGSLNDSIAHLLELAELSETDPRKGD
jgi:alpha-tubulin suppressor-like RCC1 family protein